VAGVDRFVFHAGFAGVLLSDVLPFPRVEPGEPASINIEGHRFAEYQIIVEHVTRAKRTSADPLGMEGVEHWGWVGGLGDGTIWIPKGVLFGAGVWGLRRSPKKMRRPAAGARDFQNSSSVRVSRNV
jgi:hypothetical protein